MVGWARLRHPSARFGSERCARPSGPRSSHEQARLYRADAASATPMGQTKADIRATYNRIAESFAARRREPWPEVLSFIEALRRGSRVLDLGAGNGRHAKILARRGIRPVAVDFSRRLLMIGQTGERGEDDSRPRQWGGGGAVNRA